MNKRRRILLVVRWPVGGIRTFLKYVIESLPEDAYEFHFVGVASDGMASLEQAIGGRIKVWTGVPETDSVERSLFVAVSRVLRTTSIHLIHAHGFTALTVSALPSLIFGVPLICTSHDIINGPQFKGPLGFIKKGALLAAIKRCRVIHSVSHDAEHNLLQHFPTARSRSVAIVSGVNVAQFHSAQPARLKEQLNLPATTSLIGFFGRFMSPKGFRYLVDAVELLRNLDPAPSLHVVCFGAGAFIREEQADIQRRGLENYFSFTSFAPDPSSAMKGCDLIVVPSTWEACGLVPMEALAAGVPVVGSDCVGLREVLEGTPAVQVKAGDARSLADGIVKCINIGRKPFEDYARLAVARFDIRNTADQLHGMYTRVLA